MNVHGLDRLLKPKRIAIAGVTINPNSVGGKVLANLVGGAFRGVVYPVNSTSEAIMGVPCCPDIESIPVKPDLVIICTPAEQVPDIIVRCGEMGVEAAIIMSAGFGESGPEGRDLSRLLKSEIERFPNMRVLGPNCLGIIVPGLKLNASFASGLPAAGRTAFISQSGALCTSVLDWARDKKIGFSYFVSIGNSLDVDFADLIDYFGEDESTDSIILYIESIKNARRFMTAARAFARTKPIIVYKAGRFPASAAVAASHTGALASEDAVYDAAFRRAGMARVMNIGEIFDCVELIGRNRFPQGSRLGIVTNAGGPGVMAVDSLMELGGELAALSSESIEKLNAMLPSFWSGTNPVDVLGDANAVRYGKAAALVLKDENVDALLVILTPQAMTTPEKTAKKIGALAAGTAKPVLAAWLGGESVRGSMNILIDSGIATYSTPEQAVRAFMTLVKYADNLQDLYETPRDVMAPYSLDHEDIRVRFGGMLPRESGMLSEEDSKALLKLYGIPVTVPKHAGNVEKALRIAEKITYPVVLKISSPDITHKSDAGGVALDIRGPDMLRNAWDAMMKTVSKRAPDANIQGATLQKMTDTKGGVELILGARRDPVFGTVIMVGKGGVATEIWGDTALGLPPLNDNLARRMLRSLRIYPMLEGFRGDPGVDMDRLIDVIMRFSYLVSDNHEIVEMDVNPLLCMPNEIIALDSRASVDPSAELDRPYRHLALRPYPTEYVKRTELSDGTEVLLRPIKPEDEPMWLKMLGSCSRESIYSRFGFFYNWDNHDAAVRYCYIDYDREIAIVAETCSGGEREIHAIGRLVADPDLETVEYAILVDDPWQNRGLGGMVTEYCEAIARDWGIGRIVAQTTVDNGRMIHLFEARGYTIKHDSSTGEVHVSRELK